MFQVKLVGANTCRRYQLMGDLVLEATARAGIEISLVEETEVEGILRYRTVNLPMLFVDGKKIAQRNPFSRQALQRQLQEWI